jgi:hypothetical protein
VTGAMTRRVTVASWLSFQLGPKGLFHSSRSSISVPEAPSGHAEDFRLWLRHRPPTYIPQRPTTSSSTAVLAIGLLGRHQPASTCRYRRNWIVALSSSVTTSVKHRPDFPMAGSDSVALHPRAKPLIRFSCAHRLP